jgi:peptidoglycan/xylan/chitin deacetylase (PgdA/CDA1 family)
MSGHLLLVFDDGSASDREMVHPALADLDASATFAVVPERLGREGHLDPGDLAALADAGHEVLAHGRRHRYCQAHRLAGDVAPGDDRLRVTGGHVFPDRPGGVHAGDEMELVDALRRVPVTVGDTAPGDDTVHVDLASAVGHGFDAVETVLRPTDATLRDEVVGARDALREHGVDPSGFVFPYDAADPRAWRLAASEYAVVPNAAVRSLPNPPGTDPTNLRRWYLETDHLSPPELADYLDAVSETGGLGILAGHSDWDTVTPERVRRVVGAARERDVAVTTASDWLATVAGQ